MPLLQQNVKLSGESFPSLKENPFVVADRGAKREPKSLEHSHGGTEEGTTGSKKPIVRHTRGFDDHIYRTTCLGLGTAQRWPAHPFQETKGTSHEKQHSTIHIPSMRIINPGEAEALRPADIAAGSKNRQSAHGTNPKDIDTISSSLPRFDHPKPDQLPAASSILKRTERYGGGDQSVADGSHTKEPAPSGRLFSPPYWLREPRKQAAGDALSQLRHVKTKSHSDFSHVFVRGHAWAREWPRPIDVIRSLDPSSQQNGPHRHTKTGSPPVMAAQAQDSPDTNRPAGPSPPTALHVTHHQRRELWMDHHRPHAGRRSASSTSPPFATALAKPRAHEHADHSLMAPESSILRRSLDSLRQQARSARAQQERQDQHRAASPAPAAAAPTPTPDVPPPVDEDDSSIHHASIAGDLELRRPDPVVPVTTSDSDHTCRWRDRYLVLAAEIRALKAEMASRTEGREQAGGRNGNGNGEEGYQDEDEDDMMGLLGLTIVMRRSGNRRDVVIETDLTRDCEGEVGDA